MFAKHGTSNFGTLNLKCLNKCLQNIFGHKWSQINWYSRTCIIFPFMFTFGQKTFPGNKNTSLLVNLPYFSYAFSK